MLTNFLIYSALCVLFVWGVKALMNEADRRDEQRQKPKILG